MHLVPGEAVQLTTSSHEKTTDDEGFSVKTSFQPTETTPKWNHVQPNGSGNESLRLKELTDLCQDNNFNMTRCNSRFAFDGKADKNISSVNDLIKKTVSFYFCKQNISFKWLTY